MADQMASFPRSFGVLLFPQFELLDSAGPLETLICLSHLPGFESMSLSLISKTLDPVSVGPIPPDTRSANFAGNMRYVPTHTFETAPPLDVLIVPGGAGCVVPHPFGAEPDIDGHVDFIRRVYEGQGGRSPLKYIISVCNGTMLLQAAGVLDGKKATTNKDGWQYITSRGPKTEWIAKARWVADGNVWTTSGVSAGTDGVLAWLSTLLPEEIVKKLVGTMEWIRADSANNDPFAEWFGCEDVPRKE